MRFATPSLVALAAMAAACNDASAQEKDALRKDPAASRFFDRPIDYWQRGLALDPPAGERPRSERNDLQSRPAASQWGQFVRQPDGTLVYHELPRPLVELLEDPSPEKIRAYFEWKLARTQKILKAAEAIKEYRQASAEEAAGVPVEPSRPPPLEPGLPPRAEPPEPRGGRDPVGPAAGSVKLTYFHQAGCSHCERQDKILAGWLKEKPWASLEIVEFGAKPELWKEHRVRGTPSLLIESVGRRPAVFLEGLSEAPALDQALRKCLFGAPAAPHEKEDPR
jgi:hypothetical protein